MKKNQVFLFLCLTLVFISPVLAFTGETPAVRAFSVAGPQEQERDQDFSLLAAAAIVENSAVNTKPEAAQQKQEVISDYTPAYNGYNLQAYNSNEVASKAVNRNIGMFSNNIKERFSLYLSRSGKYLEMMKEILRQKDVPENIVFLSLLKAVLVLMHILSPMQQAPGSS